MPKFDHQDSNIPTEPIKRESFIQKFTDKRILDLLKETKNKFMSKPAPEPAKIVTNIVKPVALRPKKVDQKPAVYRLSTCEPNLSYSNPLEQNANRQSRFIDQRSRRALITRSTHINDENKDLANEELTRPHLNLIKMYKVQNLIKEEKPDLKEELSVLKKINQLSKGSNLSLSSSSSSSLDSLKVNNKPETMFKNYSKYFLKPSDNEEQKDLKIDLEQIENDSN